MSRARTTTADIPLARVRKAADNPRTYLDGIEELAASIKELGQLVPIVVESQPDGTYDVLAGHRRCAALELLGHTDVRAEIRKGKKLDDVERLKLMLAENSQRRALDPIDEAIAYRRLIRDCGSTQLEIALLAGTSDFTVSRRLELLAVTDKEWAEVTRRCKARNYTPEAFARAALQKALRS